MGWVPDVVVDEMRGSHQLGLFLRIDTDPALHVWFGVHDTEAGYDSIDPAGTVYLGGGRLIGVPDLEILVNGTAGSVEFVITGIDPATGAQMIDSLPPVRGASVQMGLTTLDRYFQPMTKIIPIWTGTAAFVSESSPVTETGSSPSLTLSLSVVAGERTRSRPSRSIWTSAHQTALAPGDRFCDQVGRLAIGVIPVWPRYN